MRATLTDVRMAMLAHCTCDHHCDSPCPIHWRENELQNDVMEACAIMKEVSCEPISEDSYAMIAKFLSTRGGF